MFIFALMAIMPWGFIYLALRGWTIEAGIAGLVIQLIGLAGILWCRRKENKM